LSCTSGSASSFCVSDCTVSSCISCDCSDASTVAISSPEVSAAYPVDAGPREPPNIKHRLRPSPSSLCTFLLICTFIPFIDSFYAYYVLYLITPHNHCQNQQWIRPFQSLPV